MATEKLLGRAEAREGAAAAGGFCPPAVAVALDLTPGLGLRGPTDFFGRADKALLLEIDAALTSIRHQFRYFRVPISKHPMVRSVD